MAREEGYAYVYVSNESPTLVDLYFDDVTMSYTPSSILQYNEYYPFGLQTANSWTRENVTTNNFLYNEGTELSSTTGMYDLFYRNYDPALGRFHQVDPMAGMYGSQTPYNYANNDPVYFNDPTGLAPGQGGCSWCNAIPTNTIHQDGGSTSVNMPSTVGVLFDQTWAGGWANVGGIGMGMQAMHDSYTLSNSDYVDRYGVKVTKGSDQTVVIIKALTGKAYVYNPWAGYVSADEVLSYSGELSNQKWWLRHAAYIAKAGILDIDDLQTKCSTCGLDFFIGAEMSATKGRTNFDATLKNGLGITYREGATVIGEVSSSTKYGGSKSRFQNSTKYISEYGLAAIVGFSYSSTTEIQNRTGALIGQNEQLNVGALGILGIQINWSAKGLQDIRFGLDGGLGLSVYYGAKLNLQIGGIYVFDH